MEEVPVVASSDAAWTHLFKSLNLLPDFQDVEIEVDDQTITIVCKDASKIEAVKKALEENLAIPEKLMQSSRTQLNVANENGEIATVHAESIYRVHYAEQPPAPPKPGDGLAIFKNVFGEEFSVNMGMKVTVHWDVLFAEREGTPLLMTKNPVDDIVERICAKWAEDVSQKASQIPLFNLRRLFRGQPLLTSFDPSAVFHYADLELLKRCFGFVQKGNDKYFYCDYDLLYKVLFSPQVVEYKETEEDYATLELDKKHLIAYLRQVFNEGLFMELLEGRSDEARPVLLPSPTSQAAPAVVVLMLDVSGSMERTDGAYEANVLALIEELAKRCTGEHDQLIIVPFADQMCPVIRRYSFADRGKISADPNWLKCGGSTRMYGSLVEVLKSKEIQGIDHHAHNLNLILVTDGRDNVATDEHKQNLDGVMKGKEIVVPQFFTVGYGKEYDAKLCAELTTITGGHHQELKDISQLAAIQHIEDVVRPRTLVEFKKAVEAVQAEFISVYDQPIPLNTTIRAGDRFVLNGREMSFAERKVVVEQFDVEDKSPETVRREANAQRVPASGGVAGFWNAMTQAWRAQAPRYGKPVMAPQSPTAGKK